MVPLGDTTIEQPVNFLDKVKECSVNRYLLKQLYSYCVLRKSGRSIMRSESPLIAHCGHCLGQLSKLLG